MYIAYAVFALIQGHTVTSVTSWKTFALLPKKERFYTYIPRMQENIFHLRQCSEMGYHHTQKAGLNVRRKHK